SAFLPQADPSQPSGLTSSGSGGSPRRGASSPSPAQAPIRLGDPALAGGAAVPTVAPPALGGKAPLVFTSAGPQPVAGRIIGMVPQALDDTGAALSPNGPASAESGWSPLGRRALPPGGVINTPVGDVELPRPVSGA